MTPPARVVCIGNALVPADQAGPLVYKWLCRQVAPSGVEVLDGGLGGLSLLPLLEGAGRVVFVDQVAGFGQPGWVVVLDEAALLAGPAPSYGHGDGLAYLVHAAAAMRQGPAPEMALVGIEGAPTQELVERAALQALAIATRGLAVASEGASR